MDSRNDIYDLVNAAIHIQILRNPQESVIDATAKLNHLIQIAERINLDVLDPTKSARLRGEGKEVSPKRESIDNLATYISALRACTDRQPGFEERVDNALKNLQNLFILEDVKIAAAASALEASKTANFSSADLVDATAKLAQRDGIPFDAVKEDDAIVYAGQLNYNRAFYDYLNTEVKKGNKVESTFADLVADVIITSVAKHQEDGKKSAVLTELAYNAREVEKILSENNDPALQDALKEQGQYFKKGHELIPPLELSEDVTQHHDYQDALQGSLSDLSSNTDHIEQLAQLFKDIDVAALTDKKHADKPALDKLSSFLDALNKYATNKSTLQSFCANNSKISPLDLYKNALIESSAKQEAQQDKVSRKIFGLFKNPLSRNKGDVATTSSVLTTLLTNDRHLPSVINAVLNSQDPANRILDEAMKYADKGSRFELNS